MLEVDGSKGGGQLLRSALTLSALTGEPFRMTDIRGARPEPGLRPQHLAAVELLADVCDAEVSEVGTGTAELTFRPGAVQPGEYATDIGTAGSITLLFDALLPLATVLEGGLAVTARGGTHVKWSPTMAHYRQTKLPLVRRRGLQAAVDVERPGFYPAGGGAATLRIGPSSLSRFEMTERGAFERARIHSLASTDLADSSVAERQRDRAVERLSGVGLSVVERTVSYAAADSPGSAIAIRLDYERAVAGFDALGEAGKPAEDVADDCAETALAFDERPGAVDRHTADQLLVFLALAGGRLRVPEVTDHVETNSELLAEFGFDLRIDRDAQGALVER